MRQNHRGMEAAEATTTSAGAIAPGAETQVVPGYVKI